MVHTITKCVSECRGARAAAVRRQAAERREQAARRRCALATLKHVTQNTCSASPGRGGLAGEPTGPAALTRSLPPAAMPPTAPAGAAACDSWVAAGRPSSQHPQIPAGRQVRGEERCDTGGSDHATGMWTTAAAGRARGLEPPAARGSVVRWRPPHRPVTRGPQQ